MLVISKNTSEFTLNESLLLWEKVAHAKIILGYMLNAARVTDEEFLTFVTTHPSEITVGIFYTPFLSQKKA